MLKHILIKTDQNLMCSKVSEDGVKCGKPIEVVGEFKMLYSCIICAEYFHDLKEFDSDNKCGPAGFEKKALF